MSFHEGEKTPLRISIKDYRTNCKWDKWASVVRINTHPLLRCLHYAHIHPKKFDRLCMMRWISIKVNSAKTKESRVLQNLTHHIRIWTLCLHPPVTPPITPMQLFWWCMALFWWCTPLSVVLVSDLTHRQWRGYLNLHGPVVAWRRVMAFTQVGLTQGPRNSQHCIPSDCPCEGISG